MYGEIALVEVVDYCKTETEWKNEFYKNYTVPSRRLRWRMHHLLD